MLSAATKMPPTIPGDRVAVVGTGYMGLGMVSLFKVMGYGDIVAIDLREEALCQRPQVRAPPRLTTRPTCPRVTSWTGRRSVGPT